MKIIHTENRYKELNDLEIEFEQCTGFYRNDLYYFFETKKDD